MFKGIGVGALVLRSLGFGVLLLGVLLQKRFCIIINELPIISGLGYLSNGFLFFIFLFFCFVLQI